jgi:hypothetical protein
MISTIYVALHYIFIFFLVFSVFFTDYKYSTYLLFTLLYLLFLWYIYGCFIKDYESFIKCKYENQIHECETSNTNINEIKAYENTIWWNSIIILTIICALRAYYKFNFIPFTYDIGFKIFIYALTINFIILLFPAIHHYKVYKNNKILVLYIVTVLIICIINTMYFLYQ